MSTIKLSKHTAREMGGRGILFAYIVSVIGSPERTMVDPNDPKLTRAFRAIPEFGGRVLRVVHRPDGADIFVVTAHWDRGARR